MPSNQGTGNTLCPFFRAHTATTIACEGFTDDCSLTLRFTNNATKTKQKEVFCDCRYKCCEVYRMVMEAKYPEDR